MEQGGYGDSKHLQEICHQYDPSRPVTQGMDTAEAALKSGFAQVMDVPGFNYRVHILANVWTECRSICIRTILFGKVA